MKFERLEQQTTPSGVYAILKAAILDGSLPPGSQLREAHIADDMGISRAPVREALSKLVEDELAVKIAFRGAFVAQVSPKTVEEIASIRFHVEPYAAELSLDHLRTTGRAELLETVAALHRATDNHDVSASIDAHLQFHRMFYENSGHGLLRDLWEDWESKLRLSMAADHRTYSDPAEIAAVHERLAELVMENDLGTLRTEVASHIHAAPGKTVEEMHAPLKRD